MTKFKMIIMTFLLLTVNSIVHAFPAVPGEFIIKLKTSSPQNFFKQKSSQINLLEKIVAGNSLIYRVGVKNFFRKSKLIIKSLKNDSRVKYIEPNYIYSIDSNYELNDPKFSLLWGMSNTASNEPNSDTRGLKGADINALRAWELTTGSHKIKIAIIDTGIDYNHKDLKKNMWTNLAELNGKEGIDDDGNGYIDDIHGYDFANKDGDPMDDNLHGTHVAGTIGAVHNNKIGVAGVMGKVSLVAIKFLTDAGSGTLADAVKAINYATKLRVDVMSNSWGGGGFSQTMKDAIVRANEAGIIFVAAAGNTGSNNDITPQYPSNYDLENVISVAALTAQNTLATFSCYGKKTVHIAAPGHNILSTTPDNSYKVLSGTSMATPHVSGAIGLLLSYVDENKLTPAKIKERLIATSIPVSALRGKTLNGGRMDLENLLTNHRPYRNMPVPGKWKTVKLKKKWESSHPYLKNSNETRSFVIEGAKFIRVKIAKLEIEKKYDFLQILNNSQDQVEKIWGIKNMYTSDYIEGDTFYLKFSSDDSVNKWGFLIDEIEVQY